jgi:flagellar secretion chaperone FliS
MANTTANYSAYKRVDVETASQGKLVVMLFNGAIQRAEEAKRQLEKGHMNGIHSNLIRAQEIVAELRSALNLQAGPIAQSLDQSYEYFQHLLIQANVRKDAAPIDECIELMTGVRDAWKEAYAKVETSPAPPVPRINPHGNSVMNIEG